MKAEKTRLLFDYLIFEEKVTKYVERLMGFPTTPKQVERLVCEAIEEITDIEGKMDKWYEKETPFKPIRKKHRYISEYSYTFDAYCKCGYKINDLFRYCPNCSQKLDWAEGSE